VSPLNREEKSSGAGGAEVMVAFGCPVASARAASKLGGVDVGASSAIGCPYGLEGGESVCRNLSDGDDARCTVILRNQYKMELRQ
jgi:hypothetical protein